MKPSTQVKWWLGSFLALAWVHVWCGAFLSGGYSLTAYLLTGAFCFGALLAVVVLGDEFDDLAKKDAAWKREQLEERDE